MFKIQKIQKTGFRWLRRGFLNALSHRKRPLSVANGHFFTGSKPPKACKFPEKTAFNQNRFSRPWKLHFARLNSRFSSTDHKLSNGVIIFGFGVRENSQNHPARPRSGKCLLRGSELMFSPRSTFFGSKWKMNGGNELICHCRRYLDFQFRRKRRRGDLGTCVAFQGSRLSF